jgi:hypothetical protein
MKFHLVLVFWRRADGMIECSAGYAFCENPREAEAQVRSRALASGTVPIVFMWAMEDAGIDSFVADLQKRVATFREMLAKELLSAEQPRAC